MMMCVLEVCGVQSTRHKSGGSLQLDPFTAMYCYHVVISEVDKTKLAVN